MSRATDRLSTSQEDYLEAIARICDERKVARAKDIAGRLGVRRSSVTCALQALAERQLINYAPYDLVTLTASGEDAARGVIARHGALRQFFEQVLGIPPDQAEEGACRMEHGLPEPILTRLVLFVGFVDPNSGAAAGLARAFRAYCRGGIGSPAGQTPPVPPPPAAPTVPPVSTVPPPPAAGGQGAPAPSPEG